MIDDGDVEAVSGARVTDWPTGAEVAVRSFAQAARDSNAIKNAWVRNRSRDNQGRLSSGLITLAVAFMALMERRVVVG